MNDIFHTKEMAQPLQYDLQIIQLLFHLFVPDHVI